MFGAIVSDANVSGAAVAPATQAAVHAASEVEAITAALEGGTLTGETPIEAEAPLAETKDAPKPPDKFEAAQNAAKRARSAAARNRELMAQGETQKQELARRDYELAQARQVAHQARAEAQRVANWEQEFTKDPYAALQQAGMTPEQITQRILKDGSPESMIERVNAQLAEERQARINLERRLEQREASVRQAGVRAEFFAEAAKADAYPNLAEVPTKFILPAVQQLRADLLGQGYAEHEVGALTHDQVCTLLEREFSSARKAKAAPANTSSVQNPAVFRKTLTQKLASSVLSTPTNYDDLSTEEQIKHLSRIARAGGFGKTDD